MSAIAIKNIVKQFDGVCALDDLSLEIPRGAVAGVVGPNGSGKSTLVNVLSGMLQADDGLLYVDGEVVRQRGLHRLSACGVTRTFQEVRVFEQMTVLDNVLVVLTQRSVISSLFRQQNVHSVADVRLVLEMVGLWEKRGDLASTLSYGQRKLLEVARVLVMQGMHVYLFDEPFAGLFPSMVRTVVSVVQDLRRRGKSVILIEHNMELIRELSDVVIVMNEGKLLAYGTPDEVLDRSDVAEVYLGV